MSSDSIAREHKQEVSNQLAYSNASEVFQGEEEDSEQKVRRYLQGTKLTPEFAEMSQMSTQSSSTGNQEFPSEKCYDNIKDVSSSLRPVSYRYVHTR
jgi:hypothetical protein